MVKMKIWDRLTLWVGGAATILTGILSLAGGFALLRYATYEHVLLQILPYLMIGFGVFSCYDGMFDIMLPRRYHPRRKAFISQPTEHGEMRIAVSAIENLILRCVETHKEVKVISMQINNRRGAVSVDLRVAMSSNISIPHAVEQIQTQIKRYLAASSGIELREVGVSVERSEGDEIELPVEPLAHAAEMMAAAAHAEQEEISMHQRVFGRDTTKSMAEQVAEAEAIAPPAEEQAEVAEEALPTEENDLPSVETDTEFAQEGEVAEEAVEEAADEIVMSEAGCDLRDADPVMEDVGEAELLYPEPEFAMVEETEIAQEDDETTGASEEVAAEIGEEATEELPVYEMQDDFAVAEDFSDEEDDENSDAEAQE